MRLRRRPRAHEPAPARPPEWEYVPEGWEQEAKGWAVDSVARGYRDKWPDYVAAIVGRLAGAAGGHLYVARVPVALRAESFVVIQRPYAHGYDTEYLGWVLNRRDLLATAGLPLAREFLLDARFSAEGAPENPVEHRSFLFNR
jgi:hypothetical protein